MSITTEDMVLGDDETSPTPSQEDLLLKGGAQSDPPTNTNAQNVEGSTNNSPTANLAQLKHLIEANANAADGEMLMSLHSGEITVTHPRSRSKSERNKSKSKREQVSNINPHERIKNDLETNPQKRFRETGGTPPSATHPSKKTHGKPVENNTDPMDQHILDKQEKKTFEGTAST